MSGRGGKRRGAGRKRGVPNKLTAHIREAVENAFSAVFSESRVPYGIAAIVFGAVLLYAGLA